MIDENIVSSKIEKDEQGRTCTWIEERRDPDGILISKRLDEYTYYETGEINVIRQRAYDGEGSLVSEKTVTHFTDGRRPVVTDLL